MRRSCASHIFHVFKVLMRHKQLNFSLNNCSIVQLNWLFLLEINKLEMLNCMTIAAYVLWTYLLYQLYEIKMSLPFKQTFYIVWYYSSWNKSFEDLKMPLFTWFYGTKLHFKEYKFGSMYLTSVYKSICRWMCMHFILMLRFELSSIHYHFHTHSILSGINTYHLKFELATSH